MSNYKWHGEPVQVEFGFSEVIPKEEMPGYWLNYEHSQGKKWIESLKVTTQDGKEFCISNHSGIGVNKLLKGGWPSNSHFSLPLDTFHPDPLGVVLEFNRDAWEEQERNRDAWLKENNPDVWAKRKALLTVSSEVYAKQQKALQKYEIWASRLPKSEATGVVLALLFGPFGLLYSSPGWGFLFLLFHGAAAIFTLGVGNLILWFIGILLSLEIVRGYNRKVLRATRAMEQYRMRMKENQFA